MQKYLIIKKRKLDSEGDVLESASANPDLEATAIEVESAELREREANDASRDPNNELVVASAPFSLIKPFRSKKKSAEESLWHIKAVGANEPAPEMPNVTVAVLDTGINDKHKAFKGMDLVLRDFYVDPKGVEGDAPDFDGHGTHCAGSIFGQTVGEYQIGVAPTVGKALIAKVLGEDGGDTESIINAIRWAQDQNADVISMSLGFDFGQMLTELMESLPYKIAFSRALMEYRKTADLFKLISDSNQFKLKHGRQFGETGGSIIVAASGNESIRNVHNEFDVACSLPADTEGFVSVGAVDENYEVASFSNSHCRIVGPGVNIFSASHESTKELVGLDGTSMATPHVAGVLCRWVHELFPEGERPARWAQDVVSSMEHNVQPLEGHRSDIGIGLAQVPPNA